MHTELIKLSKMTGIKEKLLYTKDLQSIDLIILNSLSKLAKESERKSRLNYQAEVLTLFELNQTPNITPNKNIFLNSLNQIGSKSPKQSSINSKNQYGNGKDRKDNTDIIYKLENFSLAVLIKSLFNFDFKGRF